MSIPSEVLQKAGEHLLRCLCENPVMQYSEFYGPDDSIRERLLAGMQISEDEDDWYSAESLIDDAVFFFEKAGWVTTRFLDDKVMDGEPNYEIALTERATEAICDGVEFPYRDYER